MKNLLVFLTTLLFSSSVYAAEEPSKLEISIGDKNAPITVTEYTSLTCNHCADFHLHVLPHLKNKLIKTGQMRIVIKPFAMDKVALNAFKMIQALPEENRELAMTKLFSLQSFWMDKAPEEMGKLLGLKPTEIQNALNNQKIENALLSMAFWAQKNFKITATPSFLFGDNMVEGAPTLDEFTQRVNEIKKR